MDDPRDALQPLLRRLWARLRTRGVADGDAREAAAREAARMLACDVAVAREVMASIPSSGPRRPL